jgi:polyphosphate kinase 2
MLDSWDEEIEMDVEDYHPLPELPDGGANEAGERDYRKKYFQQLFRLQGELVKLQDWVAATKQKVVILFEGRDAAGKGGAIKRITQKLNPRVCRVVALPAPNDRERTQWYFQRYVTHLPAAGEIVLFDRSWYNRAGVEKVMGFATDAQVKAFLKQAPAFEQMLVDDGILLFKYWLCCDQEKQEERFAERLKDPLKRWKLSPIDVEARKHYDDYTRAREAMLKATHTPHAPWTLVDFNDQKRGRLTLVRDLLKRLPDTNVPPARLDFPPIAAKPKKERFGVLHPIPDTSRGK